jgi:hypothetical protein
MVSFATNIQNHTSHLTTMLSINRTPAPKPRINLAEVALVRRAFAAALAIDPTLPVPTAMAHIVAAGTVQGLDLSQEATALTPHLEAAATRPLLRLA